MVRVLPVLGILLGGCSGPNDETLLAELRVLAMVPDAPEIAPGETTTLSTTVVDPAGQGGDVLVWTCTFLGETCLEDDEGRSVSVVPSTDGTITTAVTASPTLAAVASAEPLPLIFAWALVCEDGLCPLIEQVQAGETIDPALWADPFDWMDDLPLQGTSLATTTLDLSTRPAGERHAAPSLSVTPMAETVAPEETLTLDVLASGELGEEAKVWGYAEGGGFSSTDERPDATGALTFDWVAPAEAGAVPVYLVLVDGLGGTALWQGSLAVE